jgi:NAD(P)H dehydrogenase (quinone)
MLAPHQKILVTGASGHFGGLVLTHLTQTFGQPASDIVATSRTPENLASWVQIGVDVRRANFEDPSSLIQAFKGAEKVLLISTDSLNNDLRLRMHRNAVEAAKRAGVAQIFYTSMPQPETSRVGFALVHAETELAVQESGLKWTILRNNWYFEGLINWIPDALASGRYLSAAGDGRIAYISRDDLARAAAAALVADWGVKNQTFTLTGAEALDIETVASQFSKTSGRPIEVIQVTPAELIEGAMANGMPESLAIMLASFDAAAEAGDLSAVTSDYSRLTAAEPQTLAEWLPNNLRLFQSPALAGV